MHVLALIHGENVRSEIFGGVVAERGHEFEEWSLAWETPLPRPLDDYGAVLVFGGAMHADQDDRHPWLREENFLLQRLLMLRTPVLGVCLGAQLLAKAAHAEVYPAREREVGWIPVELSDEAEDDPLFRGMPRRFDAFQWHFYTYDVPGGGVELARSDVCTQAFRLGELAWGVQFHAEVSLATIESWVEEDADEMPMSRETFLDECRVRIGGWNELGSSLCEAFVEVAERAGAGAPA